MNDSSALTDKILEDAALYAEKVRQEAKGYAEAAISRAKADADAFLAEQKESAEKEAGDFVHGKEMLARLEAKKALLAEKQRVIDGLYRKAVGRMSDLSEEQYLSLTERLIEGNARPGDTVVFAANCPVDREKLQALPVIGKFGLKVQYGGKFNGGIVISGAKCDILLSFDYICSEVREVTEADVARRLFGD